MNFNGKDNKNLNNKNMTTIPISPFKNALIIGLPTLVFVYFFWYWKRQSRISQQSDQTEEIGEAINRIKQNYFDLYMNYKNHSQIQLPELRIDLNASIDFNISSHWLLLHDHFYKDKNLWLMQCLYKWSIDQKWNEFPLVILNSHTILFQSANVSEKLLITMVEHFKYRTLWIFDFTDSKLSDNAMLVINNDNDYFQNLTSLRIKSNNFIVITRKDHVSLLPLENGIFNLNNTVEISPISEKISRNYLQVCSQNFNQSTLPFGSSYRILESWQKRYKAFSKILSNPGSIPFVCQNWPILFNKDFQQQRSLFYFFKLFIQQIMTDYIEAQSFYRLNPPLLVSNQVKFMMDTFSCLIYKLGEIETLPIKSGIIEISKCSSNIQFSSEEVLQLGLFKRKLNNNDRIYYIDNTFASLLRSYYFSEDISQLKNQIESIRKNVFERGSHSSTPISPWIITHLTALTDRQQNLEKFLKSIFMFNDNFLITSKNLPMAISYANELYGQDNNEIVKNFISALTEVIKPYVINFTQPEGYKKLLSTLKECVIFRENLYDKINITNGLTDKYLLNNLLRLLKDTGISYNSEIRKTILKIRDQNNQATGTYELANEIDEQLYDKNVENISNDAILEYQNILFLTHIDRSNFNCSQYINFITASLPLSQPLTDSFFKIETLTNLLGGCAYRISEEKILQMIHPKLKNYLTDKELLRFLIHYFFFLLNKMILSDPDFDNYCQSILIYKILGGLPLSYLSREIRVAIAAPVYLIIALLDPGKIKSCLIGYIIKDIGYRVANNGLPTSVGNEQKNQKLTHQSVAISTNFSSFYRSWARNYLGKIQRSLHYFGNVRKFFNV